MKKLWLLLLLSAVLISCKKENENPPVDITKLVSTRTLNINGHYILTSRTYLPSGQLQKVETLDEATGISLTQTYFYKDTRLDYSLVKSANRDISKVMYVYGGNTLIKMQYMENNLAGQWELSFEKIFEYKNQQLFRTIILPKGGTAGAYDEFTFTSGNVAEVKSFSSHNQLLSSTKYEYDQNFNPLNDGVGKHESLLEYSINNPIKVTYIDYILSGADREYRYEYEHNAKGYPLKKSIVYPGAPPALETAFSYL